MRYLTLIALAILFAGCHYGHTSSECHYDDYGNYHCHDDYTHHDSHETTTIVTTSADYSGGSNNNIIIIEEQPSYCDWDNPYYHDPEYCTFDDTTCCMWLGIGVEETYCYYEYCGWELEEVYMY